MVVNGSSINGAPINGAAGSVRGSVTAPSPLGNPVIVGFVDFSQAVERFSPTYYYRCELEDGETVTVLPISSWQATLQTGLSNYVQAVVPAVDDYTDAISGASAEAEFVIYRGARINDGATVEVEIARAPLEATEFTQGPFRSTCVISGYSEAFAEPETGEPATDRTLTGIRSIYTGYGDKRVRCAIDWFLRPGQVAIAQGDSFTVAYMNFFVQMSDSGTPDGYMDVGSRN